MVEQDNPRLRPTQPGDVVDHRLLALPSFAVLADLAGAALAQIDVGRALEVVRLNEGGASSDSDSILGRYSGIEVECPRRLTNHRARLFAESGNVGDFETDRRQHVECLLTDGIGELFPSQPRVERVAVERGLPCSWASPEKGNPRSQKVPMAGEIYKSCACSQSASSSRVARSTAGWSPKVICAALLIEHPRRHRLPLRSSQLDVLHVVTAVFSQDREVVSPVEGVIWIPNGDFAPVTGIIPVALRQHNRATH